MVSSRISAHQIEAEVDAITPSMVVLSQAYYHPWKAFVDDRPVRLWRANHAFQALEIPPGKHRVVLKYRDAAFALGSAISLATLATVAVAWLIFSKTELAIAVAAQRNKKHPDSALLVNT